MTLSSIDDGERLVALTAEHWVKYVVPAVIAALLGSISVLLFLLAGLSAHHYDWLSQLAFVAGTLLFFFAQHWYFMQLLSDTVERVIVTNRRLLRVRFTLILEEDILEISFDKMKTVEAKKEGLLQNLLHYGSLIFETKMAAVGLVPHPNRLARIIQDAMRSHH